MILYSKKRVASPLAVQRLNSFDYLSADVRQMLYGFSSVSNLFNICGLPFSHGGHGWTRIYPVGESRAMVQTLTRKDAEERVKDRKGNSIENCN